MSSYVSSNNYDYAKCLLPQTQFFIVKNFQSQTIATNANFSELAGYSNPIDYLGCDDYHMKCPAVELADTFMAQDRQVITTNTQKLHLTVTTFSDQDIHLYLDSKQAHRGELVCNFWRIDNTKLSQHMYERFQALPPEVKNKIHHYYMIVKKYTGLTRRESEVLYYLMIFKSSTEIAQLLFISKRTVQHHIERIKSKMMCNTTAQLVELALYLNLNSQIPCGLLGIDDPAQFMF